MSLEEIKARALAAAAEKQQQLEQEATATREAALETEVQTHQLNRAELAAKYGQRLGQIGQKKEQLAARQSNRERELGQIDEIRQSLGIKDTELATVPQTIEELKQTGLSDEELDPYLRDIAAEQERLETERQQLLINMEGLQSQVSETDEQVARLAQEEENARVSSDLAAEQGEPLTPDAMDKIRDEANLENARIDSERKITEQAKQLEGLEKRQNNIQEQLKVLNEALKISSNRLEANNDLVEAVRKDEALRANTKLGLTDKRNAIDRSSVEVNKLRIRFEELDGQARSAFDAVQESQGERMSLDDISTRKKDLDRNVSIIKSQIDSLKSPTA